MLPDIEIAQSIQPKNIKEIARNAGIDEKYLEQYGNYKAKVDLSIMKDLKKEPLKILGYRTKKLLMQLKLQQILLII